MWPSIEGASTVRKRDFLLLLLSLLIQLNLIALTRFLFLFEQDHLVRPRDEMTRRKEGKKKNEEINSDGHHSWSRRMAIQTNGQKGNVIHGRR